MKRCSRCKESFPPEGFHKGQRLCRACNTATVKAWRKANPEMAREQYRRNKLVARERKKMRGYVTEDAVKDID